MKSWRDVVDFEGLYQVSDCGDFRKHPEKQGKHYGKRPVKSLERAKQLNRLGYCYVDLCKDNRKSKKTVHQIVAAAFIPKFEYGMHINHIDGNKQNNHIDNLELSNPVHNNTHAHASDLIPKPGKSKYRNVSIQIDKRHKTPKLKFIAAIKIDSKRHYIGCFKSEIEAAKAVDDYLDKIGDTSRQRNFS